MIFVFSLLEATSFVAACVIAARFHQWEPATFVLVLSIFFHMQFEALEAQRARELRAKALSEPATRRRGGLPWASYYLLAIAAISMSACGGDGEFTPERRIAHSCAMRFRMDRTHAESVATLDYRPVGFSGERWPACAMFLDSLPRKTP